MATATKAPGKNEAKPKAEAPAEKLPSKAEAVRDHEKARAAFNAHGAGWKPDVTDTTGIKVRKDLRIARKILIKVTGAANVRDAYEKAGITPVYRTRGAAAK